VPDELGNAASVDTPGVHQWLQLWNTIGLASPAAFAAVIAILESLLSFGIWSGAEGFHLPFHEGMTDLGPSAGYIFASLALFFAAAGSVWSVDSWLRPRLGGLHWLASPAVPAVGLGRG
jgi:thiosulfate dehydrogenase [quinone] large subunit